MNLVPMSPLAAVSSTPARRDAPRDRPAVAVVRTMRELEAALAPVVGPRGIAALCRRSLQTAAGRHPWLADHGGDALDAAVDFDRLARALDGQRDEDAAAAGEVMVRAFRELLTSLMGVTLTEQLLRGVRLELPGDASAQGGRP